jgi:hypothetical protein
MSASMSIWRHFTGQNDVQPILHVPMIYENLPYSAPRWEYRVLRVDAREEGLPDQAYLNELGAQGWMLVSVLEQSRSESGSIVYYYFVRPQAEAEA